MKAKIKKIFIQYKYKFRQTDANLLVVIINQLYFLYFVDLIVVTSSSTSATVITTLTITKRILTSTTTTHLSPHEIRGRKVAGHVGEVERIEPLVEGVVEAEVKLAGVPHRPLELAQDVAKRADL